MINPKNVNVFEDPGFLQEMLEVTTSLLGAPAAEVVINTWKSEYANRANNPAVLRKFAKVFCSTMGNAGASDQYYYKLYEVFKTFRSEAPALGGFSSAPLPSPTLNQASAPPASRPAAKAADVPPSMVVFQAVVSNIVKLMFGAPIEISEPGLTMFKSALEISLPKDASRVEQYLDWFKYGKYNYALNGKESELSEIVHQLYLSCCSQKGPIETDQIFGHAVKQASSLEAAFQFSPNKLL